MVAAKIARKIAQDVGFDLVYLILTGIRKMSNYRVVPRNDADFPENRSLRGTKMQKKMIM